ncbi:MAG: cytochrome c peroxidase [Pseudomonadota bacterium]
MRKTRITVARANHVMFCRFLQPFLLVLLLSASSGGWSADVESGLATRAELGDALYHDVNLSLNRTQSCATCHAPGRAFIDDRLDAGSLISAASLGDDGITLGDRNSPTAGYAAFSPAFVASGVRNRHNPHSNNNTYNGALGGQFLDGRAADLQAQAGAPPISAAEMGLADKAAAIARLQENSDYVEAFERLYGSSIFDNVDQAYDAMTQSIAEFEQTSQFAPFDSKYDRFLTGDYTMTFKELTGRAIFFSQFANCNICHQLHPQGDPINRRFETFSGYEYHNIGVPENTAVRALNGVTGPDLGLFNNPEITDTADQGKFKTPTLRNVAVTEPYMHNGVFRDLRTVIEFYDHFVNPVIRANNPETGFPWEAPEVPATVANSLLLVGDPMTDNQVESMVCFLRTLTDQQYEHLIQDKGIDCN